MTRILTYNILMGAAKRVEPLVDMISSAQPDIVGLAEATRPDVVEKLGQRLGMQHIMSGCAPHSGNWQVALLSRLPIVYTKTHTHQTLTKPLLEVCLEETGGRQITVFVIHMAAAFSQGWAGDGIRRREARELIQIMAAKKGTPHAVIGDFFPEGRTVDIFFPIVAELAFPKPAHWAFHPAQQMNAIGNMADGHFVHWPARIQTVPHLPTDPSVQLTDAIGRP